MGLGTRLKEILKEKNMTIKELSEISGVSRNTLYSITKRDNVLARYDIVEKIAAALKITPEELTLQEIDYLKAKQIKNARLYEVVKEDPAPYGSKKQTNLLTGINKSQTLAAHFDGDEFTEEELEQIRQFAEFVKSKRNNNSLEVNAAHERTDVEVTDEMRKHDDDLMKDDNF